MTKSYTAQKKVIILRKHLLEKIPISDICERYELRPTVFYRWQKQFFEQGNTLQPSNQLSGKSLIVKTEDNDSKMVSVKEVGKDSYHCKVGEVLRDNSYNDVTSGVGESMKGEDVLTCRQPHTSSEGSYTQYEFNLHLRHMFFNSYYMSIRGIRVGHIRGGKCEEI